MTMDPRLGRHLSDWTEDLFGDGTARKPPPAPPRQSLPLNHHEAIKLCLAHEAVRENDQKWLYMFYSLRGLSERHAEVLSEICSKYGVRWRNYK